MTPGNPAIDQWHRGVPRLCAGRPSSALASCDLRRRLRRMGRHCASRRRSRRIGLRSWRPDRTSSSSTWKAASCARCWCGRRVVDGGQPLLRLDTTSARTRLRRLVLRKYRLEIMKARLEAEMQLRDSFVFRLRWRARRPIPRSRPCLQRQTIELQARREGRPTKSRCCARRSPASRSVSPATAQASTMQQRTGTLRRGAEGQAASCSRGSSRARPMYWPSSAPKPASPANWATCPGAWPTPRNASRAPSSRSPRRSPRTARHRDGARRRAGADPRRPGCHRAYRDPRPRSRHRRSSSITTRRAPSYRPAPPCSSCYPSTTS